MITPNAGRKMSVVSENGVLGGKRSDDGGSWPECEGLTSFLARDERAKGESLLLLLFSFDGELLHSFHERRFRRDSGRGGDGSGVGHSVRVEGRKEG